ncbi:hypothetical protein FHG66_03135 [Rubellimicrobium rubrum]|uniref:Uncharacterized protein n=1 Tax=Rubellimicrobium rubrum TaxID=2585369 RepID=A0A5C4N107_9RHOB|nr:hypothetical protein [Rubellimicrobium rubrum]TNC51825.1 hypothetical protein FHG66_03135 [Rubellimicrobium rubrum]
MSKPTSHSEVENVLLSIRRLISDTRPEPVPADVTPPGRLVLMPSLRVGEGSADSPLTGSSAAAPLILEEDASQKASLLATPQPAVEFGALTVRIPEKASTGSTAQDATDRHEQGASPDADGPPGSLASGHADLMAGQDQAALRALIVEIVRDELRGEFGERVTRNLRKIIRQELLRTLDPDAKI